MGEEALEAENRRERRIDIASASLLSIATVLAAWSAFQSAKWSGEQATAYAQAGGLRQESVRQSTLAGQLTIIDVSVFEQIVDAFAVGDRKLEDFYRERAREEFKPALEAWIALARDDLETAPDSPFAMPEYVRAARGRVPGPTAAGRSEIRGRAHQQSAIRQLRAAGRPVRLGVAVRGPRTEIEEVCAPAHDDLHGERRARGRHGLPRHLPEDVLR